MTRVQRTPSLEITPAPTPEERAALERALSAPRRDGAISQRAWWEHGLRESVFGDAEDGAGAAPAPETPQSASS